MSLTPKQDMFCLAYVETGNASEAYRRAYDANGMKPASVNRKAKELLDNVKIAARLDELRAATIERHEITVDRLRDMLLEDREFARETGKASAMVSASMGLAKLYGHLSDKVDVTSAGQPIFQTVYEERK